MECSKELLQRLNFQHKEFPDGWFWFLQPEDDDEMLLLSKAMGFMETIAVDLPDTIILQVNDTLDNWQYVYGADAGHLTNDEALNVLSNLLNEKTAREEL